MPEVYDVPEGLVSSWVDRARTVTREKTGAKIRGTTTFAPVHGPWFSCRLLLTDATPENRSQGRVKAVQGPQLSYSLVSEDGLHDIVMTLGDVVEVESNQETVGQWQLSAHPFKIRRLEELLGGALVSVRRVVEPNMGTES